MSDEIFERLAILETKMTAVMGQNDKILLKLNEICPLVRENSWWIERIKLGFVLLAITGLGLGIVSWIIRSK